MALIMNDCQSVFITSHGGPDVLEIRSAPIPDPKEHEVLVEIKFSGINFADIMSRMGLYTTSFKPPYRLGMEIAGVVVKAGSDKYSSMVGQTVVGMCRSGGYSTFVNAPAEQLFVIDDKWQSVSAAIPVNYLTAYFMMVHQGNLRKDETILIHGIGGGVGIAALQIAKKIGSSVIGTASGGKHSKIKELGVDQLIDYQKEDFSEKVMEKTNGKGVDLILDSLGGEELAKSYSCLSEFGRVGAYGFSTAVTGPKRNYFKILPKFLKMPKFNPRHMMMNNQGAFGFHLGMIRQRKDLVSKYGKILFDWLEDGTIVPIIDSVFELDKASHAHKYIGDRKNFGKVLLSPSK